MRATSYWKSGSARNYFYSLDVTVEFQVVPLTGLRFGLTSCGWEYGANLNRGPDVKGAWVKRKIIVFEF